MTDGTMYQVWVRNILDQWQPLPKAYETLREAKSVAAYYGAARIVEIRAIMCL